MVHAASYIVALAHFCYAVAGQEMPVNKTLAALWYDSGVIHEDIMALKMVRRFFP